MSRTLVLSLIAACLSAIVGCSSAAQVPANTACDESWTPPGELKMSFADSAKQNATATTQSQTEKMKSSFRPNANDRPTRGAVHAATY